MLYYVVFLFLLLLFNNCSNNNTQISQSQEIDSFISRIAKDTSDFYHVDFSVYKDNISALPIGMFDSGTGGLTVLNALLNFDKFDIATQSYHNKGDGINDFINEGFIYLGDQANMPYGNYSRMNKSHYLKELILKDVLFLLGNKYYNISNSEDWQIDKQPVKTIIIACNTATAYGKQEVDQLIASNDCKIKVIGVIDAGINGALSTFERDEDGSIAVIATAGTVSSNGYKDTFLSLKTKRGYTGHIDFFQQSGEGIAGAIDEEINFIDRNAKTLRENYQGPSLNNHRLQIKQDLLSAYNFDTTSNNLLFEKTDCVYTEIQLNSPENYIRFQLVNLCEQMKCKKTVFPLKTLILGCTHYPYYKSFFQSTLKELYNLKLNGKYVYRTVLSNEIQLVDPSLGVAQEVHQYLYENKLLNKSKQKAKNEFYISIPDIMKEGVEVDSMRNFTYSYKYGRNVNTTYDIKQVPLNNKTVNQKVLKRIQEKLPNVYEIIRLQE